MRQHFLSILAATTLGLAASDADASTVYLDGFTYGPATIATVQSAAPGIPIAPFRVYAGEYFGTLDGHPFVTFCAELTQYLEFKKTYNDYTVVDGVAAWGATKSGQFDRLFSALFDADIVTNANGSGLAQAAIWETLYETTVSNGFTTGTFQVTSADPMINAVSAADWSLLKSVPIGYHVDLLHSPTAQDLILISAITVPEPSEVALLLAGLLGLGVAARRRTGSVARDAVCGAASVERERFGRRA